MLSPLLQDAASVAYLSDYECRVDLSAGTLNDERQYVAALATRIRDFWRSRGLTTHLHAQALPAHHERRLGCDAALLLHVEQGVKVGLFEAKWPRFFLSGATWDSLQKSTGRSHFSDQLARQERAAAHAVVWEVFLVEAPPGTHHVGLDLWAATSLWRSEVTAFNSMRPNVDALWTHADAWALVRSVGRHRKHIGTCVRRLMDCSAGKAVEAAAGLVSIGEADGETIRLPVGPALLQTQASEAAQRAGLSAFLYADLREARRRSRV